MPSLQMINQLALRVEVSGQWLATGVEPESLEPLQLIDADVALRLGEVDEAERIYRAHLQPGDPARATALAGLGQIAFRAERVEQAIELLEQALAAHKGSTLADPGAVDTLGRAYAIAGAMESSIALFERARAEAAEANAPLEQLRFAVLLANALIDVGAFGKAERALANVIRVADGSTDPVTSARIFWSQSTAALDARRAGARGTLCPARARDPRADGERRLRRNGPPPRRLCRDRIRAVRGGARAARARAGALRGRAREARRREGSRSRRPALSSASSVTPRRRVPRRGRSNCSTRCNRQIAAAPASFWRMCFSPPATACAAGMLLEQGFDDLIEHGNRFALDAGRRLADLLESEGDTAGALDVLKRATSASASAVSTAGND